MLFKPSTDGEGLVVYILFKNQVWGLGFLINDFVIGRGFSFFLWHHRWSNEPILCFKVLLDSRL